MREFSDELLNEWGDVLVNGDYEQGKGSLCNKKISGDKEYCCLGVLCEEFYKGELEVDESITPIMFNDQTSKLPEKILNSGFPYNLEKSLVRFNDGGATFEEIGKFLKGLSAKKAEKAERKYFIDEFLKHTLFNDLATMEKVRVHG